MCIANFNILINTHFRKLTCAFRFRVSPTNSKHFHFACPQYPWNSWDSQKSTDILTQGYKNPPVPRRLAGPSQIPPKLSPAYTNPRSPVSGTRLHSKHLIYCFALAKQNHYHRNCRGAFRVSNLELWV